MHGAESVSSKSMKKGESQDRRSRKRKDPQLSSGEPVGSTTDSTPTLKNENKMLVPCLGRDQDSPSSIKGSTDVVLALKCTQPSCPMPKKRRSSNNLENKNPDQNLVKKGRVSLDGIALDSAINTGNVSKVKVRNQKVEINKSLEAAPKSGDEHNELHMIQKKKRTREGKKPTDPGNKCQLRSGDLDKNMMENMPDMLDDYRSSKAASASNEEKRVCAVQQTGKRVRVGKRYAEQENNQLEIARSSLSDTLETSNFDQNSMEKESDKPNENKGPEAVSIIADEQKEESAVQKKEKKKRVQKKCTDLEIECQLNTGLNNLPDTRETGSSDQNLIENKSISPDENQGSEAEQNVGCVVPQKEGKKKVRKRFTDQEKECQIEIGHTSMSNTLESSNADQNLMEKNPDQPDENKGPEAASGTADEQKEVCAVQNKEKNKRVQKRYTDLENEFQLNTEPKKLSDTSEPGNSDKKLMEKKSISPDENQGSEAEQKVVCIVPQKEKKKKVRKRCTEQEKECQIGIERSNMSDTLESKNADLNLMEEKSDQPDENKDPEAASGTADEQKEVRAVQKKEKKTRVQKRCVDLEKECQLNTRLNNLSDSLETGNSDQKLMEEKSVSPDENQGSGAEQKVVSVIPQKEKKKKVLKRCIDQEKECQIEIGHSNMSNTLESSNADPNLMEKELVIDQDNLCDDHLPHENGSGLVDDPCVDTLRMMSEMVSPLELCKESCNSTAQDGKFHCIDESPANHPSEKSASRKRRKRDKIGHSSHEVEASDDLLDLHPSVTRTSSSNGGTSITSLDECQREEIAPSSDMVKDIGFVGTDIRENQLAERPTSLERTSIGHTQRKLLILDLNGLLVDIVSVLPKGYTADKRIARKALLRRPFCDGFLKFCFERFNVGVWSSRTKKNVDSVVDYIMGDARHKLLFCWNQNHCTKTGFPTVNDRHKPIVFKELKKLWDKHEQPNEPELPWEKGEYNESNTLLLDDSPYKALLNPRFTAIFPRSYQFHNKNDNSLGPGGDLRAYLERIASAENVQKFIEENPFGQRAITSKNPSWSYYLKIINTNNFCLPT